ncbi:HAD-IIIC family phosphatase [Streptomyces sp. NPDC001348]
MNTDGADTLRPAERPPVKCVVWDLDNTLWHGVLAEDAEVVLREGVADVVRKLDARGVLQSVASRNHEQTALARLQQEGLAEYFLAPQIGWDAKSVSLRRIAETLNIGLDTFLFLDDDPFEREEVRRAHPGVRVAEVTAAADLLARADLDPGQVTADGGQRRRLYQAEMRRADAERDFTGPPQEFLASLGMRLTVRRAREGDLLRAEELTIRTHQLNATGYTYSYEELDDFRRSSDHLLLVAELTDRFGDYGTIGLVLMESTREAWTLKLLLASCRVMSRGIGTILLNHLVERSRDRGVSLAGEFVLTDRNRQMLVAYRFAGFVPVQENDGVMLLEHRADSTPVVPAHVHLVSEL